MDNISSIKCPFHVSQMVFKIGDTPIVLPRMDNYRKSGDEDPGTECIRVKGLQKSSACSNPAAVAEGHAVEIKYEIIRMKIVSVRR
jgi:hypothetical protein